MKNRITIYLGIIMIVLLSISIIVYVSQDHVAPKITVPASDMTYIEGQDTSVLLEGVSAVDDKDDNLTKDVRIYDIAILDNGIQAAVTYAVYDYSNNLGKATKIVNYQSDSQSKKTESASVEDGKDTEPSEEEKKDEDNDKSTTEEEELGEGYDDPELVSDGSPVIRLNTHEVHIKAGDYFYTMDYVEDAVDDKDSREYLYRNMYLDSVYDENTAGSYELIYYCVDSDGNRSNDAKLMLYVDEEE